MTVDPSIKGKTSGRTERKGGRREAEEYNHQPFSCESPYLIEVLMDTKMVGESEMTISCLRTTCCILALGRPSSYSMKMLLYEY